VTDRQTELQWLIRATAVDAVACKNEKIEAYMQYADQAIR